MTGNAETRIFPLHASSIVVGEHFPLYLARIGFSSHHTLRGTTWTWPSGLREIIEGLGGLAGSLFHVKENCSLIPSIVRVMPAKDVELVHRHFDDALEPGMPSTMGHTGPYSSWIKYRLARCPKCVMEDIAPDGLPFWRRDHLLPGLLFCGKHQIPLHLPCWRCANFRAYPSYTQHAGFHCGCGLLPIDEAATLDDSRAELEIEVAQIAARLLNSNYLPSFNYEGAARVIANTAHAHGIIKNGRFNRERARELILGCRYRPLLERTEFFLQRRPETVHVFRGLRVPRHPIRAIALLCALHTNWDEVEQQFESEPKALPQSWVRKQPQKGATEAARRSNERNFEDRFNRYAALYAIARRNFPDKSHTQLMLSLPSAAQVFLSQNRLANAGYDVPLFNKRSDNYYRRLDKQCSEHICAAYHQLVDERCEKRVSRYALAHALPKYKSFKSLLPKLPLTRKALVRYEETKEQFKVRLAAQRVNDLPRAATADKSTRASCSLI
jgi:hypothetical protein